VQLGLRDEALRIASRMEADPDPLYVELAELFLALGELDKARVYAISGFREAWADGPPHCYHSALASCRKVMKAVGGGEPPMPPFDPAKLRPFPFEADLKAMIAERASKADSPPSSGNDPA
jgi:hypothetical protein